MSRIGKQPVAVPQGVTIDLQGQHLKASGPKGALELDVPAVLAIVQNGDTLQVAIREADKTNSSQRVRSGKTQALWGTFQRLLTNVMAGVTEGFVKKLDFQGIGWRAEVSAKGGSPPKDGQAASGGKGRKLVLMLGHSHPIEYHIPEGIEINVEKTTIIVSGIDKQQVGQVAAEIRSFRKPEPYKGKGIRYVGEHIRRKTGKQAKGAGGA